LLTEVNIEILDHLILLLDCTTTRRKLYIDIKNCEIDLGDKNVIWGISVNSVYFGNNFLDNKSTTFQKESNKKSKVENSNYTRSQGNYLGRSQS